MGRDKDQEKKKLIVYLDDSNDIKQAYVIVEELNDSFVTFKTENNRITIPISRLLKIKEAI
jgi:hypothetical protein